MPDRTNNNGHCNFGFWSPLIATVICLVGIFNQKPEEVKCMDQSLSSAWYNLFGLGFMASLVSLFSCQIQVTPARPDDEGSIGQEVARISQKNSVKACFLVGGTLAIPIISTLIPFMLQTKEQHDSFDICDLARTGTLLATVLLTCAWTAFFKCGEAGEEAQSLLGGDGSAGYDKARSFLGENAFLRRMNAIM